MYRIQGADLREYGPVPAEQVRAWVAENRLNRHSLCAGEDGVWKPLGQFPEFAEPLAAVAGVPPPMAGGGVTVSVDLSASADGGRERALRRVRTPALFLSILAVISGLLALVSPVSRRAQVDSIERLWPQAPAEFKRALEAQSTAGLGVADVVQTLLVVASCGVVLYGAAHMRRLDSFAWSVVACAFSMLACTGCCCGLGLVAGIWSLSVINGPDVRGHFRR